MEQLEINKRIFNAMLEKANEFLKQIEIPAGTYTANELCKMDAFMGTDTNVSISVDNFVCEIPSTLLPCYIKKFASLAKAKTPTFVVAPNEAPVCEFTMDFPKESGYLSLFCDKKSDHATCRYVFIDAERNNLVATTRRIVKSIPFNIVQTDGQSLDGHLMPIKPEFLSELKGKRCEVYVYDNEDSNKTEIVCGDKTYITMVKKDDCHKYLDYVSACYRPLSDECHFTLENHKELIKFLKSVKNEAVSISVKEGSNLMSFDTELAHSEFKITNRSVATLRYSYNVKEMICAIKSGWNGELWFNAGEFSYLFFECKNAECTVICGCNGNDCAKDNIPYTPSNVKPYLKRNVEIERGIVPASHYQSAETVQEFLNMLDCVKDIFEIMSLFVQYLSLERKFALYGINVSKLNNVPQDSQKSVTAKKNKRESHPALYPRTGVITRVRKTDVIFGGLPDAAIFCLLGGVVFFVVSVGVNYPDVKYVPYIRIISNGLSPPC